MGNEPFPNNTNTSIMDFDGVPKPAYYVLRSAYEPCHVSARFGSMCWTRGDEFHADVFSYGCRPDAVIRCRLITSRGTVIKEDLFQAGTSAASYQSGTVSSDLHTASYCFLFSAEILESGKVIKRNCYPFTLMDEKACLECDLIPLRNELGNGKLECLPGEGSMTVRNTGDSVSYGIVLRIETGDLCYPGFPGFFTLFPGEEALVTFSLPTFPDEYRLITEAAGYYTSRIMTDKFNDTY